MVRRKIFDLGSSFCILLKSLYRTVLGIRDILVRIRIPGSVPLTNGSGSGFGSSSRWREAQKHVVPADPDPQHCSTASD
jgi:hypothetical protein